MIGINTDLSKLREYPWTGRLWYTKCKGLTMEEIIDKHPDFFCWMVKTFQDVTPSQAQYFKERWGYELKSEYIQDVPPYEYVKGDTEEMYMELCECKDLDYIIRKYRPKQLDIF